MSLLIRFSIFSLIILFFSVPVVNAQLFLAFSDDQGVSFNDNFVATDGDSTRVDIFLREISIPTPLSTEGLVGFGIELTRTPLSTGEVSNVVANPFFDFENVNTLTGGGFVLESFEVANIGVTETSVLLASFDFQATDVGITEFSVSDNIPGSGIASDSFLTPTLAGLDSQIFSNGDGGAFNFTITTVAIPEPSSVLVLAMIASWGAVCRRRQR